MENPHQSPTEPETLPDQLRTGLRSYHVPFLIAAVCGVALAVASNIRFVSQSAYAVCFVAATVILIYDVPVCGWVLWCYLSTGEPPKLNFEPLFPSAERRALYRAWKERPQLDDDDFYGTFYADSGIARNVVVGVRREMQRIFERSLAGVQPGDDVLRAEPEMDFADVFDELAEAFDIVIPWRTGEVSYNGDGELSFNGTFGSLVRLIAACMERKGVTGSPAQLEVDTDG
jgi:hypothetical protein